MKINLFLDRKDGDGQKGFMKHFESYKEIFIALLSYIYKPDVFVFNIIYHLVIVITVFEVDVTVLSDNIYTYITTILSYLFLHIYADNLICYNPF